MHGEYREVSRILIKTHNLYDWAQKDTFVRSFILSCIKIRVIAYYSVFYYQKPDILTYRVSN